MSIVINTDEGAVTSNSHILTTTTYKEAVMSTNIYHKHHIIPKHAGGIDHPDNLVLLTVEEHSEAHRILYEKHGRWQDKLAFEGLAGMIGNEEIIKIKQSQPKTDEHKRKISEAHTGLKRKSFSKKHRYNLGSVHRGKKQKPEHIAQRVAAHIGQKRSLETRKKISEAAKGRTPTEETRKKISEGMKGKKRGPYNMTKFYAKRATPTNFPSRNSPKCF